MWNSRRSQVLGLVLAVLAAAGAVTALGLVRAGAEPGTRIPAIELDGGSAPTPSPSERSTAVPAPSDTPPPAPAPPPAQAPPAQAPEPARTGGPVRVVPPAPIPAGPRDEDDDDDDGQDDDDEGADEGDD